MGFSPLSLGVDSFSPSSLSIIVLHTRTQESQMKTLAGPAIIFLTSPCGLPQNEQKLIFVGLAIVKFVIQTVFERLPHRQDRNFWLLLLTCSNHGQNLFPVVQLSVRYVERGYC